MCEACIDLLVLEFVRKVHHLKDDIIIQELEE